MSAGGDCSVAHGDTNISSTLVWAYPIRLPNAHDVDATKVFQFGPALAGPMNLIPVARVDAPGLSSSWGHDSVSFDTHNSIYDLGTALLPRAEERPDGKETRPQAPASTANVLDLLSDDTDEEELSIFESSPSATPPSRREGCSAQGMSFQAASSKFEQLLNAAESELSAINLPRIGEAQDKYRKAKTKKPVKRVTFAKALTKSRKRAPKTAAIEASKAAAIEAPKAAAIEAPKPAVTVTPEALNPIKKAKRGRPRKLPHGAALGCWTCRLRRKSCDMLHPECKTCLRLGVPCYGFDAVPPSFMDSAQTKEAMRKKVTAIGRANREIKMNEGTA